MAGSLTMLSSELTIAGSSRLLELLAGSLLVGSLLAIGSEGYYSESLPDVISKEGFFSSFMDSTSLSDELDELTPKCLSSFFLDNDGGVEGFGSIILVGCFFSIGDLSLLSISFGVSNTDTCYTCYPCLFPSPTSSFFVGSKAVSG